MAAIRNRGIGSRIGGRAPAEVEGRNIAPEKLELLVTIVDQRRAIYYNNLIRSHEANLQIVAQAKGTAAAEILEMLGLTAAEKTVIFSVVRKDRLPGLMEELEEKFRTVRGGKGVSVAVPLTSVIGTLPYAFLANDKRVAEGQG